MCLPGSEQISVRDENPALRNSEQPHHSLRASQWVSPPAPLASPWSYSLVFLSTSFLTRVAAKQALHCPQGMGFHRCAHTNALIPSCDLMGPARREQVELGGSGQEQTSALGPSLCCSLSVPLSFLGVLHNLGFMFVRTFSASSQKAQRLRAECPLQPQTSQRLGFCVYLHFSNHCKGAILL